ncbi:MAG: amidohydrolase [Planctomycetaceae bacterium]
MPRSLPWIALLLLAPAAACADEPPDTIWSGGPILTMRGAHPEYVGALAARDGRIVATGSEEAIARLAGPATRRVDLAGRALLPGFIDTHGHMVYFGKNLVDADLFTATSVADVVGRMRAQAERTPEGQWVVGFGYGARRLAEGRHPTRAELDRVSTDRPVMVVDSSGHIGAGNSAVFRAAGIAAETPDPEGGQFAREPGSRELLGPMEETALNAVRNRRPPFSGRMAADAIEGAARLWASHGQTTAMEAGLGLGADDIDIVLHAIDGNLLPIDLYLAAKDSAVDASLAAAYRVSADVAPDDGPAGGDRPASARKLLAARPDLDRRYVNRVRLGGVKFWLDGSLDTAWMTRPYASNPPGKTGAYVAYRQVPDEVLDAAFDRFWPTDFQIHMHMNGDAAADQALAAIAKAVAKHGQRDHRPVFVHASSLRDDQIAKMKEHGAIPSFLTSGLLPGGDAVVKMWGLERAEQAMAARTMLAEGIPFTFSHDAPVSPQPWILTLVDCGVNRRTPSGNVIGPDQRIAPYDALRAVTSMAAFQLKEEATKGTLEPGKLADMVILSHDPLTVPPDAIKDITVEETIKEGTTIWNATTSGGDQPSR